MNRLGLAERVVLVVTNKPFPSAGARATAAAAIFPAVPGLLSTMTECLLQRLPDHKRNDVACGIRAEVNGEFDGFCS
jgi:hypothetical protein